MAKVISYYTATTNKRSYFRSSPSFTASGIDQFENGTKITIYANSAGTGPVMQNSFYQVRSGMEVSGTGWVYSGDVSTPTPYYTTTTDKCTPPTSVTLNTDTKVLTISGGAGGDLNTFVGWGISWRERPENGTTWGNWSADTVTTTNVVNVTVNAGMVRQFRVRTRGTAGSSYFSAYVVCPTLLVGITAVAAPNNITATNTSPAPGTSITINWTGAAAGVSNPITGYELWQSTTSDGTYTKVSSISTSETSGSITVTSDLSIGDSVYYKVKTIGTTAGYDSDLSEFTLTITGGYGLVTAPAVVSASSSEQYPSGYVRLDWSGAGDGYENPVAGYEIYRSTAPDSGFTLVMDAGNVQSAFVLAPAVAGNTYYYKVKTIGTANGFSSGLSGAYASVKAVAYVHKLVGRTNAIV